MNKLRMLIGSAILLASVFFVWVGIASAHTFRTGDNVILAQNQQVNESLFAAGRSVDISSEVNGDIFCAAQTVNISGIVHGDVICAAQTINLTGRVDGDIRLAGQTVTVGATVSGNATIAGQSFTLASTGSIGGDATIGSTDTTFNGPVGRDVAIGGNNVTIASSVGRNVKASAINLHLNSSANITGDVDFTSKNEVDKAAGAVVGGKVSRSEPVKKGTSKNGAVFGFQLAWFFYCFLAMLLTAMAIALLFPRLLQVVSDNAMPRPWKALLTGFLAFLAMPFIVLILAITVIGMPLAFMLGMLWLVVILLSGPIFGYYLGRIILKGYHHVLPIMLLGASILLVLYFIPFIGILALLSATWVGSGMLLLEVFNRFQKPSYAVSDNTKAPARKP